MRILMIAPEPFFEPRGTPFSVYHRTIALCRLGHRVDLVCYHIGREVRIKNMRLHRSYKVPYVYSVGIGPSTKKILLDFFLFAKAFSLLAKNRYDYIHVHEEASFFGALCKLSFGTRMVYDMHSSMPQQITNFEFSKSRIIISLLSAVERLAVRSAHAVIVICPNLGSVVRRISSEKRVFLIENTPLAEGAGKAKKAEAMALRKRLGLEKAKVVLYTGTLEPYQGIGLLISSASLVVDKGHDVKYVIVGGSPQQIEILRKAAQKLGLARRVIFVGQRPPQQMELFFGIADILASPRSRGTNTPLKIYSYLKSGVPILATGILSHTQVLNSDVAVLCSPEPKDMAEKTILLLTDRKLARRLSAKAVSLAAEKYSYEKYMEKTKEMCSYMEG